MSDIKHVSGSTADEINASFDEAFKFHTKTGARRPAPAIAARLHRESDAAFVELKESGGTVPAHTRSDELKAAAKLEAELSAPGALSSTAMNAADAAPVDEVAAKRDAKRVKKVGKAAAAPVTAATPTAKTAAKHDECPECGFKFTRPQAKCASASACAKRVAAKSAPVTQSAPVAVGNSGS